MSEQVKTDMDVVNNSEENEELKHDPIDGKFQLDVSSDLHDVSMTLTPAYFGGKEVVVEDVMKELQNEGIVFGIDKNIINRIFSEKLYKNSYLIAKYKAPVDGVDGSISYLYEKIVEAKPKEGENGFVDYRDLGLIRNIKIGTPIAEITFPTDGEEGTDVKGQPIAQKKGKEVKPLMGDNTGLNGDGSKIIAKADGNLKYSGNKFSVETVYNMRGDVDASSGNLDFIGEIVIRGEVQEGFKVSSLKNITVYGNITGATIEAGGDVVVKKGCINSSILSHHDVTVGFCENSKINCDGNLKGDVFVVCDVYCGGELIAQGRTGALMGGKYTCLKNLTANSIGTKSYNPTNVTVGDNAIMVEEKADCEKKIKELDFKILRCTQAIDFLNEKKKIMKIPQEKEELLSSSVKSKIMFNMEKKKHEQRIKEIDTYLENKENLSITCKKELFPGTKITINDFVFAVNDKYQYCKIYLGEDGIKTETL